MSVVTKKDYLPFQFTYHASFLAVDFRQRIPTFFIRIVQKSYGKTCYIIRCLSRVQQYSCRASYVFKRHFLSEKNMSQIYGFQYYIPVQLLRKAYHFNSRQSKNKVVHRVQVYPSLAKIEGMKNAPVLVQQFTHLIRLDPSYRLSYLLWQFADKTGKIDYRKQTKHKRKNKHNSTHGKHFSPFRKVVVHFDRPRSNCLLCWVVQVVVPCCYRFFVGLPNSSQTAACCVVSVVSSSSSTPTSG